MKAAKVGGENHTFYASGASDLNGMEGSGLEWDLNDWKWDGHLFVAAPINEAPSNCRSKQLFPVSAYGGSGACSDAAQTLGSHEKGKAGHGKRRAVLMDEDEPDDRATSLTLKLGGDVYPIAEQELAAWDGISGKRSKVQPGSSNRGACLVEGCDADLSDARDYHRRHKVCEMHAKASNALVGNATQRFCQQCSRFHLLQEFDENKKSCRRRLAGHNRRRRKTNPNAVASGSALMNNQDSHHLLISLLRILSNLQPHNCEQSDNQDLVSHFLRSLAGLAGSSDARNLVTHMHASQGPNIAGNTAGRSSEAALPVNGCRSPESLSPLHFTTNPNCTTEIQDSSRRTTDITAIATPATEIPQETNLAGCLSDQTPQSCHVSSNIVTEQHACQANTEVLNAFQSGMCTEFSAEKVGSAVNLLRLRSFDLNDVYVDREENNEGLNPVNLGTDSLKYPSHMLQENENTSPTQTCGNSDSSCAKSLASSNGDAQSSTDRIVFKLFGKEPKDLPLVLRTQIMDWLSSSPTDVESYIRPGCIILTVYLHLPKSMWEEIFCNLGFHLRRLLNLACDDFWTVGWVYARVRQHVAFVYNGELVLDIPFFHSCHGNFKILSVTPIAVPVSGRANFMIKGFNLARSTMRLLCAFEGKYLVQEPTNALVGETDASSNIKDGTHCLSFSCSLPNVTGRGFVEIEDYGLSGAFFPFVVAEPEICSEIRMLESAIDLAFFDSDVHERSTGTETRSRALDFLHEIGWLLQWCELGSRAEYKSSHSNGFSLTRFQWLIEFAMEHDWCAVVKKLLDILVGGAVDVGGQHTELVLDEMSLLHCAIEKNSKPMVEFLLRYVPGRSQGSQVGENPEIFLFRPDMFDPFDRTPLHIVASRSGSESLLDALMDDPGQVGIIAWKNSRDSKGLTPADYARSGGFQSYIHLVEQKLFSKSIVKHVVVNIPKTLTTKTDRPTNKLSPRKATGFHIEGRELKQTRERYCKTCCNEQQLGYVNRSKSLVYRPVILSMMAIATVCVCVGLIFKGPPEVRFVFPFSWDAIRYGSI